MSRKLTFGYNAAGSLSEDAVNRLLRSEFESGAIDDTLTLAFSTGGFVGIVHALLSDPELSFEGKNHDSVCISLDIQAVIELHKVPISGSFGSEERLDARVSVIVHVTTMDGDLCLLFAGVQPADIIVSGLTSSHPVIQALGAQLLKQELSAALRTGTFSKTQITLGLGLQAALADAVDIAVVNDASSVDRGELLLGAYLSKKSNTRATPNKLKEFLPNGATIAARISQTAFANLVDEQLNDKFMRYTVHIGNSADELRHAIKVIYAPALMGGATNKVLRLLGSPDANRSNLHGRFTVYPGVVHGATASAPQALITDNSGMFRWEAETAGPHIVKGNDVTFHGDYQIQSGTRIYPPKLELQNGGLRVSGKANKDIACYDDVSIDYALELKISIDPASGELITAYGAPSIDLPWYVDGLILIGKLGLSIFIGPIAGIVFGNMWRDATGQVTGKVDSEIGALQEKLMPSINGTERMRLFWEEVTLSRDGLELAGQLETGWIKGGARTAGLSVELDEDTQYGVTSVEELVIENGLAWLRGGSTVSGKSGLSLVHDMTFEQLDAEVLAERSYVSHLVTVPSGDALVGTVLAVRTAWGRYGKVRVDRDKARNFYLRWIVYNARPEPAVEIMGRWHQEGASVEEARGYGNFTLSTQGLYTSYGLKIIWSYNGSGTARVVPGSSGRAYEVEINLSQDVLPLISGETVIVNGFEMPRMIRGAGLMRVEVEDIFGRRANAERALWCEAQTGGLEIDLLPDIDLDSLFQDWIKGPHPKARRIREILGPSTNVAPGYKTDL